jgi:hypothetical protein
MRLMKLVSYTQYHATIVESIHAYRACAETAQERASPGYLFDGSSTVTDCRVLRCGAISADISIRGGGGAGRSCPCHGGCHPGDGGEDGHWCVRAKTKMMWLSKKRRRWWRALHEQIDYVVLRLHHTILVLIYFFDRMSATRGSQWKAAFWIFHHTKLFFRVCAGLRAMYDLHRISEFWSSFLGFRSLILADVEGGGALAAACHTYTCSRLSRRRGEWTPGEISTRGPRQPLSVETCKLRSTLVEKKPSIPIYKAR